MPVDRLNVKNLAQHLHFERVVRWKDRAKDALSICEHVHLYIHPHLRNNLAKTHTVVLAHERRRRPH